MYWYEILESYRDNFSNVALFDDGMQSSFNVLQVREIRSVDYSDKLL